MTLGINWTYYDSIDHPLGQRTYTVCCHGQFSRAYYKCSKQNVHNDDKIDDDADAGDDDDDTNNNINNNSNTNSSREDNNTNLQMTPHVVRNEIREFYNNE